MRTIITIVILFIGVLTFPAQSFQGQNDTPVVRQGIVKATNVNIRKGPSITKQIVGKIPYKGTLVDIIDRNGGWYKVRVGSIEGWVYKDYIALLKDTPESMPDINNESSTINGKSNTTDSRDTIVVKSIRFRIDEDRTEKVFIYLSDFYIPQIIGLEGKKPRIAIDIPNVTSWSERNRIVPVKGQLIKRIRTHLHQDSSTLRIVLDLDPKKNFTANPIYYKAENIYCIVISDAY